MFLLGREKTVDSPPETVFKALADHTRQRTMALLTCAELGVSELVELLRQPQSTVSRHLKILREAGLISDRRDGKTVLYSVPSATNGGGPSELTGRLLDWIAEQPVPPGLRTRLQAVVDRRREMSNRFFAHVGRHWDILREDSFGSHFHLEALVALLPAEWTVGDIGTGTGFLLPTLAWHFKKIIGVDPVETMLEAARQRVREYNLTNVELLNGELSKLPIQNSAVDLALAVLVLHHVADPQNALDELCRIVRAGGQVLVVEQTAHRNEAFRNRMQDRWWGFEPDEFRGMLRAAGFVDVISHALNNSERAPDAPELFVVTGRKTLEDKRDS
jgi:ArsR family transcriptional regulator